MENRQKTTKIIIHCASTPEGRDFTVADIDRWHRQRGWAGIGYHYVVYRDGTVHPGRPEAAVGAHCKGQNHCSVGVCYIGGLDAHTHRGRDTRTPEQKRALVALLQRLKARYPGATIHGHREFGNTDCPCFDANAEYSAI